ncbi:type VI secretion system Vgr family protein [Acinetobacter nematophilus]|uniref:Type VI secretion system Vgr family protein n=1 Tax=Acinetobacter nematophilus TaxID=2994642 RepID=A0A9X3DSN7_9GAMM|nr:type VI secretion system Vgr family protein [Acinetobacter nematophilus]MCX5467281.1 type VI secretion system Vgr family protein [Acinetobacter nematophilus]
MLNNIFTVLDQLGFGTQKRAISVHFSNSELSSQVMLQRIDGYHALNEGLSVELICISMNPFIELKQFIACQVSVDQVTDSGKLFRTTGIITGASQGQSDGAFTLYRLTLQDATSLWHKRRNSRVFLDKSVPEILEIIFNEWVSKSALFASSLKLDLSGLSKTYDVRPFSMQFNESDHTYLTRILREESISWLIDESNYITLNYNQNIEPQKLRLVDRNDQFKALERRNIRYHRSDATEAYDSITSLIAQRNLQSTAIHLQRWHADSLSQEDGAGTVLSSHKHSAHRDNESLSLEQAWSISPAWIRDLKGEDQATTSGNHQLDKLNSQLNSYQALQAKYFKAQSSVRDLQVGYWFKLTGHPELDRNHRENNEMLILSKHFYNQNNFPKDIQDQIEKLLTLSHWQINKDSQQERQANELMIVRRSIEVVPEYDPLIHRQNTYVQRAIVVGDGEEIYVDEWGRIKIRFLFTRTEDHAHDGGAGSNDNDTDSAWVDVLTPWAGEGYGARFLPRVGEIVAVDFFEGNLDRPFVTGRIHEGHRSPTKFDIKGKLPDTKKLSGIRSKEVAGEGFGQLRFDDSTGQISSQLQSSHGASQLNLGNLSYPKETAESEGRGEGFELRTDQWGAIRAGDGLLLSTYPQSQASGQHLHADEAKNQLNSAEQFVQTLNNFAKNQKTDEVELLNNLKQFAKQIQTDIAQFNQNMMLLTSPTGIGLSTAQDIHLSADGQINSLAQGNIHLSTQKNLIAHAQNRISLFAVMNGINFIAAQGKFNIHAQSNALDIFAKLGITIASTDDKIVISSPKEVQIKGGSSKLTLNGAGILGETDRLFEVNAGQHKFKDGTKIENMQVALPDLNNPYILQYQVKNKDDQALSDKKYIVIDEDGNVYSGITDQKGLMKLKTAPTSQTIVARVMVKDIEDAQEEISKD